MEQPGQSCRNNLWLVPRAYLPLVMQRPITQHKRKRGLGPGGSSQPQEGAGGGLQLQPRVLRVVETASVPAAGSVARSSELLQGLEFSVVGDCDMQGHDDDDEEQELSCTGATSSEEDEGACKGKARPPQQQQERRRRLKQGDVQRLILQHGGSLSAVPRPGLTHAVVAPHGRLLRVANIVHGGKFDVVSCCWLVRCARKGVLTPPGPLDYIHMTEATRQRMARTADSFGDSLEQRVTTRQLQRILRRMQPQGTHTTGGGGSSSKSKEKTTRQLAAELVQAGGEQAADLMSGR